VSWAIPPAAPAVLDHPAAETLAPVRARRIPPLAALLAAGALIVIPGMNSAFGSDEVWSLNAVSGSHARMLAILRADIHPPLYYELLFAWTRIFGTTEIAVRALTISLLLGAVWASYRWSSRIISTEAAAAATAIYLSSPLTIVVSRLGRMYTLLALVSVLSTYFYWRVFAEEDRRRRSLAWFVAANVLGSFTHIWFFFMLFAEGLHLILFVRRNWLKFALAGAASLVPYAVMWLPALVVQMRKSQEALAWMTPPAREEIGNTFFLYTAPLLLLAPFFAWYALRERRPMAKQVGGIVFMCAAVLAVPFAISYIKPVFYPRFTVAGLHLFAVAVAACAPRLRMWQLPAVLCVLGAGISLFYTSRTACDARWGADLLVREAESGDTVIFSSLSRLPVDHYLKTAPLPAVTETSFPAEIDSHPGYEGNLGDPARVRAMGIEADALIAALRSRHGSIFFFHGFRPEVDAILEQRLKSAFQAVRDRSVDCGAMGCYYSAVTVYR